MAKRSVLFSDLSGVEIDEGKEAVLTIRYADSTVMHVADITREEATEILSVDGNFVGRMQPRRGRPISAPVAP
jgi:hypothetical protein